MIFSLFTVRRLISRECVIAGLICKQLILPQASSITAGLIPTFAPYEDSQIS
jgi:hypothetical protein